MVGFWIYQMIFMLKDDHKSSPIIIAFALIANVTLNCIFYEFIKARVLHGKDKLFSQHQDVYKRTAKSIINWSMLTSF